MTLHSQKHSRQMQPNNQLLVMLKTFHTEAKSIVGGDQCGKCNKKFADKRNADRHMTACAGKGKVMI